MKYSSESSQVIAAKLGSHIIKVVTNFYGLGHETAAVLLPGFAINW